MLLVMTLDLWLDFFQQSSPMGAAAYLYSRGPRLTKRPEFQTIQTLKLQDGRGKA
jgi:hypothetical protein